MITPGNPASGLDDVIVSVRGLKTYYPGPHKGFWPWSGRLTVKAVDDVSLDIRRGQTLGLVGESGCGKTTVGRSLLQLVRPTAGEVFFEGQDLRKLKDDELYALRKRMQIIFQDPYASLDPRATVGFTISEGLLIHKLTSPAELPDRVADLMTTVGLNPAFENRYPHEFSGGQRQRVGIARALATNPTFIVGDEPISALDVSIQAQIINLLRTLRDQLHLTMLFISHDLRAVRYLSDDVAVMYLGKIVEMAGTDELFASPLHPYTQALLGSTPKPSWSADPAEAVMLTGDVPSPINPPQGCYFSTRCPRVMARCREAQPALVEAQPGHKVACFLLSDAVNLV
ncbi:MAG: ABC transporter ATP-binding protein [Anaerolineae bacterium]|nr:ABC transporter ATP-binding protein [Anaerolineae bacterium]